MQRVPTAWLLPACAALLLGACMGPPPAAPKIAYLRVTAVPDTATVYESDHFLGTARLLAKKPKGLRPGVKYLTIKAPGYFPHDLRLELPEGETNVNIKLRPVPP